MNSKNVKAIIFDWAGTTIDFGCFAPAVVFIEVFKKRKIDITIEEARKPMGLMKKEHIRAILKMERVCGLWKDKFKRLPNEDDVEELYADFEPMLFKILADYAKPIPGVVEAINKLKNRGIKIGSTTGYSREMMNLVLPEAEKRGYKPDSLVTSTDVSSGRPAPFMCYQNAINLGVYPLENMIKVGDTVKDIEEGLNAGMWSVAVIVGSNDLGLNEEEVKSMNPELLKEKIKKVESKFKKAGAHYVIKTMCDLEKIVDEINIRLENGELPN